LQALSVKFFALGDRLMNDFFAGELQSGLMQVQMCLPELGTKCDGRSIWT
jgi:hypothetical protein